MKMFRLILVVAICGIVVLPSAYVQAGKHAKKSPPPAPAPTPAPATPPETPSIPLASLPGPVRKTIHQTTAGAKVTHVGKIESDGEWYYEVETEKEGKERAFYVDLKGALASYEVFMEELPAAAQKVIRQHITKGKPEYIGKMEEDGEISYEVDVTQLMTPMEYTVAEDGSWYAVKIAPSQAPEAVRAKAKELAGEKGRVIRADKVFEGKQVYFELEIGTETEHEGFLLASDGTIMEEEHSKASPGQPAANPEPPTK